MPPGRRLATFVGRSGAGAHLVIVRAAADVRAATRSADEGGQPVTGWQWGTAESGAPAMSVRFHHLDDGSSAGHPVEYFVHTGVAPTRGERRGSATMSPCP